MTHEIIRSLETIQDQVKQELQNVRTYRAFLAVGQAIEEISEVEEIVRSLNGIRGQVIERLHDVREYRALLAVQKSVQDISEVLGILEESSRKRAEAAAGNGAVAAPAAEVADDSKIATAGAAAAKLRRNGCGCTRARSVKRHHGGSHQWSRATNGINWRNRRGRRGRRHPRKRRRQPIRDGRGRAFTLPVIDGDDRSNARATPAAGAIERCGNRRDRRGNCGSPGRRGQPLRNGRGGASTDDRDGRASS